MTAARNGFDPLRLLFSFQGRISRRRFWLGLAVTITIFFILAMLAAGLFRAHVAAETALMAIAIAVVGYWSAALIVKRLRDRGRSLWFYPVYGVAPLALYYASILVAKPGSGDPGMPAVTFNTLALGLWLLALIDLGLLEGVHHAPPGGGS